MKYLGTIARWLFIICLPVILLAASFALAFNSLWLYQYGFEKYDVSRTTGLEAAELEKAGRGLIHYFNSDEEYISLTVVQDGRPFVLFNEREVEHLKDVKGLLHLNYTLLLWTLDYSLVYALVALLRPKSNFHRRLARALVWGGGITLGFTLMMGAGIWLGFDWFFWQFHVISFDNNLWLLNPATDYLIMLFPQGFWVDSAIFIALTTTLGAVLLGGLGQWYWRHEKEPE